MVEVLMKKLSMFCTCILFCASVFAVDRQVDVYLGGFSNNIKVFNATADYQIYDNNIYDYVDITDDYAADFNAKGLTFGFDYFKDYSPIGVYMRYGIIDIIGVDRTVCGTTVSLKNTDYKFNMFYDFGLVFEYDANKYLSLCAAPAISLLVAGSEYTYLKNIYKSRATFDAVIGIGLTADIYAKVRASYFTASAGCAASIYPYTLILSEDSNVKYDDVIGGMAYSVRPYISVGVSIIERSNLFFDYLPAN